MRGLAGLAAAFLMVAAPTGSRAQLPPQIFTIDGYPVACRGTPVIADYALNDVGFAGPGLIRLNPARMAGMSTSHKLFVFAHECGHALRIMNEGAADCFAIRLGRDQGWFPLQAFDELIASLRYSPGDFTHAPGPARIANILACAAT
jgi:hypothetical protein